MFQGFTAKAFNTCGTVQQVPGERDAKQIKSQKEVVNVLPVTNLSRKIQTSQYNTKIITLAGGCRFEIWRYLRVYIVENF